MMSYFDVIPNDTSERNSQQSIEKDKRFLIRQQLYYLFHAFRCTKLAYTTGQGDCQNQHCIMMRNVVKHITKCQLGKECTFQHCPSSKEIIKHWKNCNDVGCQVCAPLRRNSNIPKKDNVVSKEENDTIVYQEQYSREKEGLDWRNQLFRIRPNFLARLTDELLPVKICEDVKNHPGYSEVNNYVKRFEIEVFQNTCNLNEYLYKLAEKFEFVYRNLLARYRLKENGNSAIVDPNISRMESSNRQVEVFFRLIKSHYERFYPVQSTINKQEEIVCKEEGVVKLEEEYLAKVTQENDVSTIHYNCPSIKQESSEPSTINTEPTPPKYTSSVASAIEAKMSPDSTSIPKKENNPERQTWTREEILKMFIPIHEELFDDKESEPFKYPVNWEVLEIPDYPTIVKQPMDLSTIHEKLISGAYKDPWEVVDDFWLMFNNAWLYNKKTSKVYKMCNSLAKIFESKIDDIMISCGYCCGREYVYLPQVLICCTPNVCLIVRDAVYYAFQNDKSNGEKIISDLTCDKYLCCEKCFNDSIDEVQFINPENNATPCKVKKTLLSKCRNNVKENEEFVYCRLCSRKWHKVCANYLEEIAKDAFICPTCVREKSIKIRTNIFKSKSLPQNGLSRHLENRVNTFLKEKDPTINEIVIRVLSSTDKVVEVKSGMKSHYCETCEMPESFKYRLKAIFAFQEIDGHEVCFFGLHVQEYGSDCPDPNSRRVYVAYLDSVHYFNPRKYRTDVYHEFLIGYLEYVKKLGFTMAHIWACPPGEGDDYIFHMHPPEQKLPKPKRLQEWYIKMLEKAMKENIVVDYKDIFSDALHSNMLSPTELPYFDGDYWPNALEEIFKEIDDESNKRRSVSDTSSSFEVDTSKREIISKNSFSKMDKKPKKRKLKRMNSVVNKRKRSSCSDTTNDVSRRVLELMEKRKENFFVIRLHTQNDAANLPEIVDPDPLMSSDLMDGRDKFLCLAREKHLEFSSVRRAKFTTLVFCYELHQEQKNSILYTCNACSKQIEVRYTCKQCEDFELCPACYNIENHCHPLYKIDPDEESTCSNSQSISKPTSELQDTYRAQMVRYSQSLQHACQCRDVNCRINFCTKMKGMIKHLSCCTSPRNTCRICQPFLRICCVHAKFCNDPKCQVPNCLALRFNWKQQGCQQRMQQAQMLRRRVALMQRGISTDPVSVPIMNSQVQSIDMNQQNEQNVSEPEILKPRLSDEQEMVPFGNQQKPFMPQLEPNHMTNNVSVYNCAPSNISYTSEPNATKDDERLVAQQYNFFHKNYPQKEEFQKHFGCWLNSNPKFKLAFDMLVKKTKRQNEVIPASAIGNLGNNPNPGGHYQSQAPSKDYQPQKHVYPGYSQPHWVADPLQVAPYPQSYSSLHSNSDISGNSMIYDYGGIKQRPQPGSTIYHVSIPPHSQPPMSPMHPSLVAKGAFPPGQVSYVGGPPQYMGGYMSGVPRFQQSLMVGPGALKSTPVAPSYRCLPLMQQQQQAYQEAICGPQKLQQHMPAPFSQHYFAHAPQMDQLAPLSASPGNGAAPLKQAYGQMKALPQQQQQSMMNPMLIPSNQ